MNHAHDAGSIAGSVDQQSITELRMPTNNTLKIDNLNKKSQAPFPMITSSQPPEKKVPGKCILTQQINKLVPTNTRPLNLAKCKEDNQQDFAPQQTNKGLSVVL